MLVKITIFQRRFVNWNPFPQNWYGWFVGGKWEKKYDDDDDDDDNNNNNNNDNDNDNK